MESNNMKAMCEALNAIRRMVNEELEDLKDISDEVRADFISIRGWCDHVLAEPPRQCDMGTAYEQAQRFGQFCHKNRKMEKCCGDCPAFGTADCQFIWAQMPYESEVTDGSK